MIRRPDMVQAVDDAWIVARPADYAANLRVFEALYEEARALGVFARSDPLEGIEDKIRLARALNVRRVVGPARPGTE